MNIKINSISKEKILFFDIETVRRSKELEVGSREFELFRKKTRNRETDEYFTDGGVVEEYNRRAALRLCYTRIVTIGVGYIRNGKVTVKALHGTEKQIIEQFNEIAHKFDYMCGANILGYDLPVIITNGYKYFKMSEVFPDRFLTSGKKPWNLENVIDIMDIFKGTHYVFSTLDEMCYHFNLPSSKDAIDGSMVSEEYWTNGLPKILEYVKADVIANINILMRMRFEEIFTEFTDKTEPLSETDVPFLIDIHKKRLLTQEQAQAIYEFCQELSVQETNNVKLILEAALVDKKGVLLPEHKEFIEKL